MITVSLNGEPTQIADTLDLQNALLEWGYSSKKCAVAINGDFVPRSRYAVWKIQADDEIDVVAAVGGG